MYFFRVSKNRIERRSDRKEGRNFRVREGDGKVKGDLGGKHDGWKVGGEGR